MQITGVVVLIFERAGLTAEDSYLELVKFGSSADQDPGGLQEKHIFETFLLAFLIF